MGDIPDNFDDLPFPVRSFEEIAESIKRQTEEHGDPEESLTPEERREMDDRLSEVMGPMGRLTSKQIMELTDEEFNAYLELAPDPDTFKQKAIN